MRSLMLAGAAVILFSVGAVSAAEPAPKTSTEDFVKAIQAAPKVTGDDAAPCANGAPRDPDGVCYTVLTDADRGMSIAKGGEEKLQNALKGAGSPAKPARMASNGRVAVAPVHQPKELSDLLITFKLGSAELAPEGKAQASAFAAALRDARVGSTRFEIAGHTDATGAADRNAALSTARAEAVRSYLVAQGVDAARLEAKGYGASQLALPTAPQDPANRRVEARRLD